MKHDERQEIGYSNQNKKSKSMPSTELSCSDILRRPQKLGPSSTYNLTLLKQCQKKWKMDQIFVVYLENLNFTMLLIYIQCNPENCIRKPNLNQLLCADKGVLKSPCIQIKIKTETK